MAGHKSAPGNLIASGLTRRQLLEIEACARCGECRQWCPVFAQDQRESITARGKMAALRKIVDDRSNPDANEAFLEGLYECTACGQCHVVCPVRIDTPELWEQARQSFVTAGFPQPEPQIKQLSAIKQFNNSFSKPQELRGVWAEKAAQKGILHEIPLRSESAASVLYFAGCTASFDPETQPVAVQSALLLQEASVPFSILGSEEPCCASKLRRMGDSDFPSEMGHRVETIAGHGITTVVASCAGCFKGLFSDSHGMWPEGVRVVHLTRVLAELLDAGRLHLRHAVPMKVTYHDPCHLGRHNRIYDEPRRILTQVPGIELVEMKRSRGFSSCCGMGGGLKAANPAIQHKMSASRIREAEATGAEALVTPCQTCYLGLLHAAQETGSQLKVLHLNEIVTRSVRPEAGWEEIKAKLAE